MVEAGFYFTSFLPANQFVQEAARSLSTFSSHFGQRLRQRNAFLASCDSNRFLYLTAAAAGKVQDL